MRRLRVAVVAGVAAVVCAASCGDAEPVTSAPSTSTPTTTLTVVAPTSSTVPPTTAGVPTVSPTTTVPVIKVEGAPGQPVDVRVAAPRPYSLPDPFPLWMSSDSGRVVGYIGVATRDNDSLHLVGSIPTVLARTASSSRREPAQPRATTAGDYRIDLGFATIAVHVS